MSKSVQLYPYEFSTELGLELGDFDDPAGGNPVEVSPVASIVDETYEGVSSRRVAGYDASNRAWEKLTFRLTASFSDTERQRVLPETSSLETDTALVVLMTCPATKFRHGVRLRIGKNGGWNGHATIQRQDVRGSVALRPQLVRVTGIPAAEDLPFATQAGTMIALGDAVNIYLDASAAEGLRSTVVMTWEDFANSDHGWRREHPDDVFHLEPFASDPRLYLNSRYAQLREIMESDAKRGFAAVLRDMTAAMIAQPALMQLATAAITSLEIDDDSGSVSAPSGWRADLLASVLPRLYPEDASDEERIQRAANEIKESDGAASLLARLGTVVQEMIASYKAVEAAVRIYEASRDREDTADE